MKKRILLLSFLIINAFWGFSQNCSGVKTSISEDYSYVNEYENFSLPFNNTWNIALENERAIIVLLTDNAQLGSVSIVKNRNGYQVSSGHAVSEKMVNELFPQKSKAKEYFNTVKAMVSITFGYLSRKAA